MNYGRFFVVDNVASRFDEGIIVFNYRGLKDVRAKYSQETGMYPIYVTFAAESVTFWAHYYNLESNDPGKEDHLHHEILRLPLSANLESKDGLSSTLSQAYCISFPVTDKKSSSYLYDLISNTIAGESVRFVSYSALPIFGMVDHEDKWEPMDQLKKKFIRKLLLDFLFDMEHTRVFQNSRFYQHVSLKLRASYLFDALANKAMFFFRRKLLNDRWETDNGEVPEDELLMYADQLHESENQWAKSVMNSKSDDAFHIANGWFLDPENELNIIYSDRSVREDKAYRMIRERDKQSSNAIKRGFSRSSKWYVRRYSLLNAIFPRVKDGGDFRPSYYSIALLTGTVLFCSFIGIDSYLSNEPEFVGFPTWAYYLLWCNFAVMSFILAAPYLFQVLSSVLPCIKNRVSPVVHFWGIHLFFPRLLIAIATGWITIFFGTNMLGVSSLDDTPVRQPVITTIVDTAIVAMPAGKPDTVAAKVQTQVDDELRSPIKRKTISAIHQLMDYPKRLAALMLLLLGCVTLFIYHQIGKFNPHSSKVARLKRTFFFGCIAFIYSYLIGKLIDALFWGVDARIAFFATPLPIDFMVYTLFAMFIGVFIQLTLEEKPMTESL